MTVNPVLFFLSLAVLNFSSNLAQAEMPSHLPLTPITDQGDTLQCWAVTATARMDIDASRRAGELLKLSPRFLVYAKTRGEVIRMIVGGQFTEYEGQLCENCRKEKIFYEQGGVFADAVEAAKLYGVMPESVYGGFPKKDEALFRELDQLIREYAHPKSRIDFNDMAVRQLVDRQVTSIMNRHLGKPPTHFEYRGHHYTPLTFFEAALPEWQTAGAIELNYLPGRHKSVGVTEAFSGAQYTAYHTGNHQTLMRVLEETLQAGEAPVVQYKVVDEDHTQKEGKIGFAVHGITPPARLDWNSSDVLDHYVLAVGAEWTASGHIDRLLVRNTWDISARSGLGYHWIEPDYLFLLEAVEVQDQLTARFKNEGLL
jgi:hypothetical protein